VSWATIGGERIQSGIVTMPYWGTLVGDVLLASSAAVDSPATLTIGDLSCVVSIVRQASFAGSRSFRVVGGYGGWRKTVGPRWYTAPVPMPLAPVLRDVAAEVGEQVSCPSTRIMQAQYARATGQAVRVLDLLAPDWWVAPDGTTTIGPRDSSLITSDKTIVSYSGGKGQFQVATETMADWMPGRTFTSQTIDTPVTIGSVTITMGNDGKVRLDVLNASSTNVDRLNDPLDEIIASVAPSLAHTVPWECRVVGVHGSGPWTLDVIPTSSACPLPGMTTIGYAPSIARGRVKPTTGGTCLVCFVNGDPQRPKVWAFDDENPEEISLDALIQAKIFENTAALVEIAKSALITRIADGIPVAQGVARKTDAVQAGPFGGAITGGSVKVSCG
jgi:hypothetical protein